MGALGGAVQLAVVAVLVVAAASKLASPRRFRLTLEQLGVRRVETGRLAVPAVELAAAVGLAAAPASVPARVAVIGIGAALATVGAWVLVRGERIECACFGGAGGATLGLRQVLALPAWVAGALLPAAWSTPLAGREGLVAMAAVTLAAAAVVAVDVLLRARESMGFRAVAASR
jgi:hypothetical protein